MAPKRDKGKGRATLRDMEEWDNDDVAPRSGGNSNTPGENRGDTAGGRPANNSPRGPAPGPSASVSARQSLPAAGADLDRRSLIVTMRLRDPLSPSHELHPTRRPAASPGVPLRNEFLEAQIGGSAWDDLLAASPLRAQEGYEPSLRHSRPVTEVTGSGERREELAADRALFKERIERHRIAAAAGYAGRKPEGMSFVDWVRAGKIAQHYAVGWHILPAHDTEDNRAWYSAWYNSLIASRPPAAVGPGSSSASSASPAPPPRLGSGFFPYHFLASSAGPATGATPAPPTRRGSGPTTSNLFSTPRPGPATASPAPRLGSATASPTPRLGSGLETLAGSIRGPGRPTHMRSVQIDSGTERERDRMARVPPGQVGMTHNSGFVRRGPGMIRIPAPVRRRGDAQPAWPPIPSLEQNQLDYFRRQYDPVLDTMPRWSFYTIETRAPNLFDIPLPGSGEGETRVMGNIQFGVRFWQPRRDCPPDCPDCRADYIQFGVPRLDEGSQPRQVLQPHQTPQRGESSQRGRTLQRGGFSQNRRTPQRLGIPQSRDTPQRRRRTQPSENNGDDDAEYKEEDEEENESVNIRQGNRKGKGKEKARD
ncbi:hypothetical protein V8F20_010923 [Naviculisporaceae sp. PSN 640]